MIIRTRSQNTSTCPQRLLKPLITSRQPVSRLPSWPSQILTNHSFWKWTPLSQKQADGRYHPITYASCVMNETEQRYHSNKQEFLTLKWVVTEQFHEYLSLYGKNRNEFVVHTDNNPLTYMFSSANLDAAGQRWVAHLASYNFSLESRKVKTTPWPTF